MGIDPGLATTGVGVIESLGDRWQLVGSGEVRTHSSTPIAERLAEIHGLVGQTIDMHKPDAIAVESVFTARNTRSAILMAHGRGAAILAASLTRTPVHEYSPLEIKQSVVGKGRASKQQVMEMVRILLELEEPPSSDHQADAIACALAHAYRARLTMRSAALAARDDGLTETQRLLARARRSRKRRRR